MNEETGHVFLVIGQDSPAPRVAEEEVVLGDGYPEIEVVDRCGVELLFLEEPSPRGLRPQLDGILVLHAPLPAAEGRGVVPPVRHVDVLETVHDLVFLSMNLK